MSTMTKNLAAVLAAFTCVGLAHTPSASAAVPTVPQTLTEQGRLLDNTNTPIDGVALSFSFSLYTTATAGTAIWTEKQTITPDQGYFSAMLGEVAPFPATIFDGSQPAPLSRHHHRHRHRDGAAPSGDERAFRLAVTQRDTREHRG
jgi:hypothetical protein